MGGFLTTLLAAWSGPTARRSSRAASSRAAAAGALLRARRRPRLRRLGRRDARPRDPRHRSRTSTPPRSRWPRPCGTRRWSTCSTRSAPAGASWSLRAARSRCCAGCATCCRRARRLRAAVDRRRSCASTAGWCSRSASSTSGSAPQLMATGTVQIWPGTPVSAALIEDDRVAGVRLIDQGTTADGEPGRGLHARHGRPRGAHGGGRRPGGRASAGSSTTRSACPRATTGATGRSA